MAAAAPPLPPNPPVLDKLEPTTLEPSVPEASLPPWGPYGDNPQRSPLPPAPKTELPTIDRLGASVPDSLNADKDAIAAEWFRAFQQHVSAGDVDGVLSLFIDDGWWRDHLALTWEFRTFHGTAQIGTFLRDRLAITQFAPVARGVRDVSLKRPYPDLVWTQAFFDFETDTGLGTAVVRLVPTASGTWKAFTLYTVLEDLKGFPERVGALRDFLPNHGKWKDQRERENSFADADPTVLIIGGGQSGLDVAARLKLLGVSNLIIERAPRIGDQWRTRYEALCLHDPVWYDHMPYMPFPPSWPVYTPAQKLADWLEYYAEAMELNIWTSTTATKVDQAPDGKWKITVLKADGSERTFTVDHVVIALGLGGGEPNIPVIPGSEEFQGQILHSTKHKSARDHIGKKVVIVGAATTAHDVANDYAEHGVDVTIYQRSPTYIMTTKEGMPRIFGDTYWEGAGPTDIADRVHSSTPAFIMKELHKRVTPVIAEADKELLEGLKKVGFKYYSGDDGSGFLYLAMTRGGGYYLDVGACKRIANGEIKVKSDSLLERITKTGLKFEDGSELEADVILYATGFDGAGVAIRRLIGEELASKLQPIWNLNAEGEEQGAWRWLGIPNLWFMMGNLSMCRYHSKHLALQIKAKLEGVYGTRYVA